MTAKGIYVEALSNALITGVSMDHVGFYGAGAASGGPALVAGVGIDVNLKNGVYHDITITDFTLTDTGVSNGAGTSHNNGGGDLASRPATTRRATTAPRRPGPAATSSSPTAPSTAPARVSAPAKPSKNVAGPPVAASQGVTVTDAIARPAERRRGERQPVGADGRAARAAADDAISPARSPPAASSSTAAPASTTSPAVAATTPSSMSSATAPT